MEIWGATDQGMVRKQNQDTFRFLELGGDQFLAVVCDGMGGAKSGDVASRLAAEVFEEDVRQSAVPDMEQPEIVKMLVGAVKSANRAVYEQSLLSPDFKGMGTTLVAVFLQGSAAYIINVGDSRCYYLSEGEVSQVTEDHSVVGLMVARGQISEEEARNHPNKNLITRAVAPSRRWSATASIWGWIMGNICCFAPTGFPIWCPVRKCCLRSPIMRTSANAVSA